MARLPLSNPAPPAPLTVTQLAALIKGALVEALPGKVRVAGEISNFTDRQHWFFSIKDGGATLRCVCFASSAKKIRLAVRDGMAVVVTGRVDFYDAQGSVQLYVDKIELIGQGALELQLQQLMAELREQGCFDPAHKLPLPAMPMQVAVITSRTSAALQDVIDTAQQRWPGCRLLLYDVHVQGDAAAPQIAAAIRTLSKQGHTIAGGIDAIILTRGGGSIEDLWAFNERDVADAIYECTIPIVAAIGHETDTTIAELVADVRCATPTQAAMMLIPDQAALVQQIDQLGHRLRLLVSRQTQHARQRLESTARHALFRRPQRLIEQARQRLDQLRDDLRAALPRSVGDARKQLDALVRQLAAVNPQNVLERGYSYTLGPKGKVLRRAGEVTAGDELTTVLSDGKVRSRVTGGLSKVRKKMVNNAQPDLFGS